MFIHTVHTLSSAIVKCASNQILEHNHVDSVNTYISKGNRFLCCTIAMLLILVMVGISTISTICVWLFQQIIFHLIRVGCIHSYSRLHQFELQKIWNNFSFFFSNYSKHIIFDKPYFGKLSTLFVLAPRTCTTVHCDISYCLSSCIFVHSPLRRIPMSIYLIAAHFLVNNLP